MNDKYTPESLLPQGRPGGAFTQLLLTQCADEGCHEES